jgi:putative glutamine amidotransferase
VAPDGLIEGIELPGDHFFLAVQWHPEALVEKDSVTRRLFAAFTTAARAYRQERAAGGIPV